MRQTCQQRRKYHFFKSLICIAAICCIIYTGKSFIKFPLIALNELHIDFTPEHKTHVEIDPIMQWPELPNGCEATSMMMVLQYCGVNIDAVEFAMEYLPRDDFSYSGNDRFGPDPEESYVGDPSSERGGWYCFEEPVKEGANMYLQMIGSDLRAKTITGASESKLQNYLKKDRPVVVWVTTDYELPYQN